MSTRRTLTIVAAIVLFAFLLSQLASCSSTHRQWRDSQTVLQNLPR